MAYSLLVEEKWSIRLGTKTLFGYNVQLNFLLISMVLCLVWILIIPHWMLISLNIDRHLFAFCLLYCFKQFGSRSDRQIAVSDLDPSSLSHIGPDPGPIYLHYL